MLPALRRKEVEVVDLVETAAVDMEEEDTMEEAAGEAEAMVSRNKAFEVLNIYLLSLKEEEVAETVDTVEAEVVEATEAVVDMTMAADITITTGMEETDTMEEAEAEVVDMVMRNNLNLMNSLSSSLLGGGRGGGGYGGRGGYDNGGGYGDRDGGY